MPKKLLRIFRIATPRSLQPLIPQLSAQLLSVVDRSTYCANEHKVLANNLLLKILSDKLLK